MTPEDTPLLHVAQALLPDAPLTNATVVGTGQFHDVVLLPGVAAIRVARRPAAASALVRGTALLTRLASAGLPFAVPSPITPVTEVDGRTAVAVSWLPGRPVPAGEGHPSALREVLDALAGVDLADRDGLLDEPHCYAGGARWEPLLREEVVPRLPPAWQAEAQRRIDAALALPRVPPSLVHGDLAGHNMHWSQDGRPCIGVLDWDLAQPYDPAVDAACLAGWHG